MEQEEFMDKMSRLSRPEVGPLKHQDSLKLTLLNARKSAAVGIWIILLPCYFLCCVVMKHHFHSDLSFPAITEDFFAGLDKSPYTRFLSPVLFMVLPLFGVIINALAILHVAYEKERKELILTIKLRWTNLVLLLVSAGVVMAFSVYLIAEKF